MDDFVQLSTERSLDTKGQHAVLEVRIISSISVNGRMCILVVS